MYGTNMMSKVIVLVFILVGLFSFSVSQVIQDGQCDGNLLLHPDFDIQRFIGPWKEYARTDNPNQQGECSTFQFMNTNNGLEMVYSEVNNNFLEQHVTGTVTQEVNTARFWVTIPSSRDPIVVSVLETFHDMFAITFSCLNISATQRQIHIWVIIRPNIILSEMIKAYINLLLTHAFGIEFSTLRTINHHEGTCFVLPVIEPGEPIILPGQCDASIPVVQQFDVDRYAGRWRLFESYGADFQQGTCNDAHYSPQESNILAITNTQVVDGQLESIAGTGTFTSTDGSGRFILKLGGVYIEVKILATDYDSYSLGYGCLNINGNQRRVYSWKMSRENIPSVHAINSMNEIIDKIQVLNNRYYYRINRTDTGCFYFPTPDPNTSVKFRGQCENIPVVTNFQPARYLGRWYDIESYPGDFQNGDCNTAFYREHPEAGIDLDVYNTQVINEALFSIRGTAVQDTDGSAKLTVSFNVGGNLVTSNYWVVATDYSSYALVYSCQPIDDEYVRVGSWKLSRTRQLQPEAITIIDEAMRKIRFLDHQYFIARDQSHQACFYYPEPQPGVPVVFPGQCDERIEAVPDFNMNLFQGKWHEIAAYPKANQDGQCFSQQFSVNATNSMRLDSFSVHDQTQSATEGHVTLASDNDLSGKLNINIWVDGKVQSIPYWILSTDYNHYALAYSCVNIDDETRGVWSWKLSKTRQLSQESIVAINDAIAKVDVLRNVYYENIQQTDTACFHLPDSIPDDKVIQININIQTQIQIQISHCGS